MSEHPELSCANCSVLAHRHAEAGCGEWVGKITEPDPKFTDLYTQDKDGFWIRNQKPY